MNHRVFEMKAPASKFDIDRYINPFIPVSRLHLLPKPVSWFLGHRSTPQKSIGSALTWWWAFFGAFCGLLVVEAVFMTKGLKSNGAPLIIGSLGASAILEYNTIDSPLSQPRNVFFGQLWASIIGVGISKLFRLDDNFENIRFVGGALSVGIASAFMSFTKTVHPPAGATALLAVTSPEVARLGWYLVPLIVLGSVLMLGVACLLNNVQQRFPLYWWTPADLRKQVRTGTDAEKAEEDTIPDGVQKGSSEYKHDERANLLIIIDAENVVIPDWVALDEEEKQMLLVLQQKLQDGGKPRAESSIESDATQFQCLPL